MAPIAYNLGIIGGALFLVPMLGVEGLAVGVVIGAAGHLLVQVPTMRRIGARIRPRVDLSDPQARRTLVLMAPRALGLGATQIVFLVMTSLASALPTGSIAIFNFAFAILQIPIGVIGVPLGVVLLPSLSRQAATGGGDAFRHLLVRGLSMLAYVMLVITAPRHRAVAGRGSAPVRLRGRGPGGARRDRGHARRSSYRAHRALADRGAGPCVLRPAGHGDAGRGRADRGRREHPRGEHPGRTAGPERPGRGDRDGRLARDAGARRCSCGAGCRRWGSGGWAA